jgi:hypothetical protein
VAGVARPVLGMLENIKEMPLRHPCTDFLLEIGQPFGLDARRQLLQVGCSVFIDVGFTVGRKSCVNLGSEARQFGLERGGKIHTALGNAESCTVGRQSWFAVRPRQELGSVIGEFLGAHDIAITGLQSISEVDEDADLKRTPVKNTRLRSAPSDEVLPALRGEAEIDFVRQFIAACIAVPAHDGHCVQQTAILRRWLDIQQIDKPEQQAAMSGVNWPEQREIVAAVPRGDGVALRGQGLDTALLRQELSYLTPEGVVGFLNLCRLQHLAKNADQRFLGFTLLIMQRLQLLLGRGLGPPNPAQHHLDQFVPTAHACLAQKSKQQRVPLAWLENVEKFADLQRRRLSSELAELGVGNTIQQRVGIDRDRPKHGGGQAALRNGRRAQRSATA